VILLLWCVRDFYVVGKGTLGPWDPPRNLVVTGLYKLSRNPMYIAVVLILIGWAMVFRAQALWMYAAAVALAFHVRVVLFEERYLSRTHGEEFTRYKARVGRWV
jgi:protein-S-isoprenylcysteine O-methyltransferase Ste14